MKQKRVFGALALSGMAMAFLSVGKTLQNGAAALPASHIFMILGFLALTKLWTESMGRMCKLSPALDLYNYGFFVFALLLPGKRDTGLE